MEKLVTTYGKSIHLWQVDRGDKLPLGPPKLMMGFTADGQAKPELVADRDRRFGISTEENRQEREDIPMPEVLPGANAWEKGTVSAARGEGRVRDEGIHAETRGRVEGRRRVSPSSLLS